jgi:hypothetical protein
LSCELRFYDSKADSSGQHILSAANGTATTSTPIEAPLLLETPHLVGKVYFFLDRWDLVMASGSTLVASSTAPTPTSAATTLDLIAQITPFDQDGATYDHAWITCKQPSAPAETSAPAQPTP